MAVFRIERTRDYTVMSNHHLRNHQLSLKAKGLLSMMLSLPDDWNYTTRGLAKICKEGVDAIGGALRELESAGYIVRHQLRDRQGRISDTEYVIYEQPQPRQPETPQPDTAAPDTDSPDTAFPYLDKPDTEKPAELNIEKSNTQKSITQRARTDSIPFREPAAARPPERKGRDAISLAEMESYRDLILENTTICHEDDSLRSYVAKFIEQYFKRNHIQYKISCCPSLHNLTTRFHPIDLLFTDIIFSDKTEMSTLLKIRKQHPSMMMVILTNNNEYAIQGYKLGILRYIMKEQLEHELPHCMDAVLARYFKHRDVLEMKFVEGKYCVYQDEIVYMESQGHKVNFHLSLGMSVRILTAHTTIDAMQLQLNQNRFVRPHKSFLVNCSYIDKIECGNILLQSGDRITISQSRKKDVDALLTAIL